MTDDRLARLIHRAGAVELLDLLAAGPCGFTELRRLLPRRVLEPALRALATEGAIERSDPGSWDTRPQRDTEFALTATGEAIIGQLSDLDVWVEVYEKDS